MFRTISVLKMRKCSVKNNKIPNIERDRRIKWAFLVNNL